MQRPNGKHECGLIDILRVAPTHTMHEGDLIAEHLKKQGGGRAQNIRERALKNLLANGLVFRQGENISLASQLVTGGDWLA